MAALIRERTPWSRVWMKLVPRVSRRLSRRGASVEKGVRFAARQIVRRLPFKGPLTFGSGIEIELELDELSFQGASAFMFASVLERFFARHAAINSFSQLTLRTAQRGLVMRWPPRVGVKDVV